MHMNTTTSYRHWDDWIARACALGAVIGLLATTGRLAAEDPAAKPAEAAKPEAPAAPPSEERAATYRNWFDVSVGGLITEGNRAEFRRRENARGGAFGGLEDFHWESKVGKNTYLEINGRALFDNRDYTLRFDLTRPQLGYVRGGFRQQRTWYDGNGGFFPQNGGVWIPPSQDELALDRGQAWFEGGLTLPNWPVISFKYTYEYRDGQKDSTSWSASSLTGGLGTRQIVPSFWDIDEKRHIFEGDLRHTVAKTDLGLGVRYEMMDNRNSLNLRLHPGEQLSPLNLYSTTKEEVTADIFNVHAFTHTRFNEKTLLTTGYSFTTLDTDLLGSRIYGLGYDPLYDPILARQPGFIDLSGGSQMKQYVMNLNLMVTPWDAFQIVPSVRIEHRDLDGFSRFTDTIARTQDPVMALSDQGVTEVAERLEARYTGLTNWVFYARGDWSQAQTDLSEREFGSLTGALTLDRGTDNTRRTQKYTVGANWYPLRQVNVDFQYYHKIRDNNYSYDYTTSALLHEDQYPGFYTAQNFTTDDANVRLTLRPWPSLTLVSRYDVQFSEVDQAAIGLARLESADMRSHIFSQSVTWIPWSRLSLQASVDYALDKSKTPAQDGLPAIQPAENNYWNASFTSVLVLDNKTDLQAHYFYYRANNYSDNSTVGLPYGDGAQEHGVTVGLVRRISDHVRLTLKYGYFNTRDDTAGGHLNYDAHWVYSGLQYRF
jgi:hypothetical protein